MRLAGPPGAVPIRPDHGTLPGWDLQSTDPMCDVPAVSRESEWNAIKHYGVLVWHVILYTLSICYSIYVV